MAERYPGYDVLRKRNTRSWNAQTRHVIDQRLAVRRDPRVFTEDAFVTLEAIAARITPQPPHRPPIPVAGLIDDKLFNQRHDGYRVPELPREREAWQRGLLAIDAEARAAHGVLFHELDTASQDALLRKIESGNARDDAWGNMPSAIFFKRRLPTDIVHAYWSHPTSWNEIGWGGPAGPRGYVRMGYDRRDPWEAIEAKEADEDRVRQENQRVR